MITEEREQRKSQKVLRAWMAKTWAWYKKWQVAFPQTSIWIRPIGFYCGPNADIDITFRVSDIEDVQKIADLTGAAFVMKVDRFDGITYESANLSDDYRVLVQIEINGISKVGDCKVEAESEQKFFLRCPKDKELFGIPEAMDRGMILQNVHPKGGD